MTKLLVIYHDWDLNSASPLMGEFTLDLSSCLSKKTKLGVGGLTLTGPLHAICNKSCMWANSDQFIWVNKLLPPAKWTYFVLPFYKKQIWDYSPAIFVF
jgi:hypothetical protein